MVLTDRPLGNRLQGRKLFDVPRRCSAPFAFRPDGQSPRCQRGQGEAHGGRRPGDGAGTLDDPGPLPGEPGDEGADSECRRIHASCGPARSPRWQVKREHGGSSELDVVTGQQQEGRCKAGDGSRLPPTAERPLPAVSEEWRGWYIDVYVGLPFEPTDCILASRPARDPHWTFNLQPRWEVRLYVSLSEHRGRCLPIKDRLVGQIWDAVSQAEANQSAPGRAMAQPHLHPAGDRLVTENDCSCVPSVCRHREGTRLEGFLPEGPTAIRRLLSSGRSYHAYQRPLKTQCADCGKSRRMRSRLAGRGTDQKASMTGSVANR